MKIGGAPATTPRSWRTMSPTHHFVDDVVDFIRRVVELAGSRDGPALRARSAQCLPAVGGEEPGPLRHIPGDTGGPYTMVSSSHVFRRRGVGMEF